MALVMDKVIEEILKYRKYKVWRCLDDNSLLALQRRDGDIATGRHPETQGTSSHGGNYGTGLLQGE